MMNTTEWITVIGFLLGASGYLLKILLDIKNEIMVISNKIITVEQIEMRIDNAVLKHHEECKLTRKSDTVGIAVDRRVN